MAIEPVSLDGLGRYLDAPRTPRRVDEVILHHTWSPTAAQYRGQATWDGIRNYHMNVRGWSDIGYHLGVGPDNTVWLLRPIHRGGGHCLNHNAHSVGVAIIGNFDVEDPYANGLDMAAQVCAAVCNRYLLESTDIFFHRDFADKTCPGTRVKRDDFRGLVHKVLAGQYITPADADVADWAVPSVERVEAAGLMTGYPDGKFHGDRPVTRQELAVVAARMLDAVWEQPAPREDDP